MSKQTSVFKTYDWRIFLNKFKKKMLYIHIHNKLFFYFLVGSWNMGWMSRSSHWRCWCSSWSQGPLSIKKHTAKSGTHHFFGFKSHQFCCITTGTCPSCQWSSKRSNKSSRGIRRPTLCKLKITQEKQTYHKTITY